MNNLSLQKRACSELESASINHYPIDVIRLANFNGFKVYEKAMPSNISGMIMCDTDNIKGFDHNKIIVVNLHDTPLRRRFTIAHELAHFFIHKKENETLYAHRDEGVYDSKEKEADYLAGNLIMPEHMLCSAVNQFKAHSLGTIPGSVLTNFISDRFQVSTNAAYVRLKQTNLI